jgi:hypothetical protein
MEPQQPWVYWQEVCQAMKWDAPVGLRENYQAFAQLDEEEELAVETAVAQRVVCPKYYWPRAKKKCGHVNV